MRCGVVRCGVAYAVLLPSGVMPWTLVGGGSAMQQPVFIMAPPPLINMGTGTPPTEVGGGLAAMIPQFLPPGFTLAYPSSHLMDNSAQDPSPTSPSPSPPSHRHQRSSGAEPSSPNPRPGVISPPLATADGNRDKVGGASTQALTRRGVAAGWVRFCPLCCRPRRGSRGSTQRARRTGSLCTSRLYPPKQRTLDTSGRAQLPLDLIRGSPNPPNEVLS